MNFGKAIKNKRLEKGLSLTELGAKLGCSAAYLSALENCRQPPSKNILKRLSLHLEMDHSAIEKLAAIVTSLDMKKLPKKEAAGIIAFYKTCLQNGLSTAEGADLVAKNSDSGVVGFYERCKELKITTEQGCRFLMCVDGTRSIGHIVKEHRKAKGLSMAKYGKLIGISAPSLVLLERGDTRPKNKTLEKIANETGYSFHQLFLIRGAEAMQKEWESLKNNRAESVF